MKNIKFRVWSDRFESYLNHVEVWEFIHNGNLGVSNENIIITSVEEDAVEQFTGILDANGKEIYEGDILQYRFFQDWKDTEGKIVTAEVFYNNELAAFQLKKPTKDRSSFVMIGKALTSQRMLSIEPKTIIGNVRENPELLYA